MLDRRHRLTTSAGFTAATRRGRRSGTRTLVLHLSTPAVAQVAAVAAPPGHALRPVDPRVGFVVSKAVGNAVTRNAVRRRLRHLVRSRLPMLPTGAVLVVRALPAAAEAPYAALDRDLDTALGRLGLDPAPGPRGREVGAS